MSESAATVRHATPGLSKWLSGYFARSCEANDPYCVSTSEVVLGGRRRRAYEILVSIGTSDHINFVGVPDASACRNVIVSVVPLIVGLTVPWPPSW